MKQAGGRQLLRGGMGGAVGRPSSSPAVGGGSGGVTGTGGDRKICRFMGTGRGVGRGKGTGGAWARCSPARIRRRWPGRSMPMSTRPASLRPWHSVAHTSPCCSKSAVYCSRCSARSHSATDSAASWPSAMASDSRGPGLGSDLKQKVTGERHSNLGPRPAVSLCERPQYTSQNPECCNLKCRIPKDQNLKPKSQRLQS